MPRTSPYPTAEACGSLVLDINAVMRPAMEARRSGADGALEVEQRMRWIRRGEAEPWATVDIAVLLDQDPPAVTLRYDIDHLTRSTGTQVQHVRIVSEPCGYGGVMWFWICPATGRRVRNLYLTCRMAARSS